MGIASSVQSKTSWLLFLAQLSTDHDQTGCGFEAVQVEHPNTRVERDLLKQGN